MFVIRVKTFCIDIYLNQKEKYVLICFYNYLVDDFKKISIENYDVYYVSYNLENGTKNSLDYIVQM